MKYVPTPNFAGKAASASAASLDAIKRFVAFISSASPDDLNESNNISNLSAEDICVWKSLDAWIVFSLGLDEAGDEYALLADLIDLNRSSQPVASNYAAKDPRVNSNYNPRANSRINPRVNSSLNPRVNSRINPRVNSSLNPRVNSAINPRVNSAINYRVNSAINPRLNSSINPRVNSSINPRVNRSFGGPFVYDSDINRLGYVLRVNDKITLAFDEQNSLWRIAVHRGDGFSVFNDANEYVEHWVSDGQGGLLRFSVDNDWIGLIV
ncbi:hypothetical protein [Caulobacter sp. UNC358MFTsu5.1]|uniref:hypothetical protein n=1 Tax=Caulobacter sp. UNC358MFTsu5.1 TaxID=1449049 RepID=UPI0012DE4A51|nr:hypothetical protein [Caulobacter sp. UNC358MFTsu5.1]